jgi:hypothetical protein
MKIFGLPLGDSGLYCIPTNIFTPFCEPKIIPLVVDTGKSHTTLGILALVRLVIYMHLNMSVLPLAGFRKNNAR